MNDVNARAHDQARTELGFCVQAPDGNWCDAHQALKFPGEEACRVMSVAYTIAESAVEVAEPIIEQDALADLRAKVEALRRPPLPWVPIDEVLALLPEKELGR